MRDKLASIIITTWNRLEYSKLCVQSILNKTEYPNYELIVVDNHSTDDTVAWLINLKKRKQIQELVLLDRNYGVAHALNIGLKKARGEFLIRSDNDMVYNQGWLTSLIRALERVPRSILQVAVFGELIEDGIDVNFTEVNQVNGVIVKECDIGGCNMAFTRKTYQELGPFPNVAFAEDSLYCNNARKLGYVIGQIKHATGTHIDHPTCSLSKRYTEYGDHRMEILQKLNDFGVEFLLDEDKKFFEIRKRRNVIEE